MKLIKKIKIWFKKAYNYMSEVNEAAWECQMKSGRGKV